jgi:hypothetical protein
MCSVSFHEMGKVVGMIRRFGGAEHLQATLREMSSDYVQPMLMPSL